MSQDLKHPQLGGYAEQLPAALIRGQYGRQVVVPMDELNDLVADFNAEVWNKDGNEEDNVTLRQITGSSGPSDNFVCFIMKKSKFMDPTVKFD